jgi:hypothetical protein
MNSRLSSYCFKTDYHHALNFNPACDFQMHGQDVTVPSSTSENFMHPWSYRTLLPFVSASILSSLQVHHFSASSCPYPAQWSRTISLVCGGESLHQIVPAIDARILLLRLRRISPWNSFDMILEVGIAEIPAGKVSHLEILSTPEVQLTQCCISADARHPRLEAVRQRGGWCS